jgi:NmrA-like family protein
VDYEDTEHLAQTLTGVHTLLCFITPQSDPGNTAQKNLIDAAIKGGVVRYAPSEWASYAPTAEPDSLQRTSTDDIFQVQLRAHALVRWQG